MVVDFNAYGFSLELDFAPIRSNRVCLRKEKIYHAAVSGMSMSMPNASVA